MNMQISILEEVENIYGAVYSAQQPSGVKCKDKVGGYLTTAFS